jgi:hypothetical protein
MPDGAMPFKQVIEVTVEDDDVQETATTAAPTDDDGGDRHAE